MGIAESRNEIHNAIAQRLTNYFTTERWQKSIATILGVIAASAMLDGWLPRQLLVPIAAAIAWNISLAGSFLTTKPLTPR